MIPRYLFYRLALYKDRQLPGHAFENCRMTRDEETGEPLARKQKIGYFVIRILGFYVFKKLKSLIKNRNSGKFKVFQIIENLMKFFELLNFLKFVSGSMYPTLVHRILEIRYVRSEIFNSR